MSDSLFRKKSLEKIESPESLNEYIRAANPGVWLILAAVILLLAGAFVWSIFGRVESTVAGYIRAEDGMVVCYAENDTDKVQPGMTVRFDGAEGIITSTTADGGFTVGTDAAPEDGVSPAQIVIERIKPVTFIFN